MTDTRNSAACAGASAPATVATDPAIGAVRDWLAAYDAWQAVDTAMDPDDPASVKTSEKAYSESCDAETDAMDRLAATTAITLYGLALKLAAASWWTLRFQAGSAAFLDTGSACHIAAARDAASMIGITLGESDDEIMATIRAMISNAGDRI